MTEHEKAVGWRRPDADALRAQAEPAELREQSPQGGDGLAADRDRQAEGRDQAAQGRDRHAETRDRAAEDRAQAVAYRARAKNDRWWADRDRAGSADAGGPVAGPKERWWHGWLVAGGVRPSPLICIRQLAELHPVCRAAPSGTLTAGNATRAPRA